MKKINLAVVLISSFLLTLFLFSCGNSKKQDKGAVIKQPENSGRIVYSYGWNTNIRVFEVDSCEYVGFDSGTEAGTSIIHKQNCKFCAERK